jgi:hypothetical protein
MAIASKGKAISELKRLASVAGLDLVTDVSTSELANTEQEWYFDSTDNSESWFKETLDLYLVGRDTPFLLYPYRLLMGKEESAFKTTSSFTLPISPQQLNITTPFAIVTTPTLNGVVEEHNSTRFRDIEIAGTMGVFPSRGQMEQRSLGGILDGLLGYTGLRDQASNFSATIGNITPFADFFKESVLESRLTRLENSGYHNLHRLRNFLETYAENKKSDPSLRLVFANYKDQQMYYVTPVSFSVRRSAASPLEYEYQLSLKAWSRFSPNALIVNIPVVHVPPIAALSTVLGGLDTINYGIRALGSVAPLAASLVTGITGTVLSAVSNIGSSVRSAVAGGRQFSNFGAYYGGIGNSLAQNFTASVLGPQKDKEQTSASLNEAANEVKNVNTTIADRLGLASSSYNLVNDRVPAVQAIANPSPEQLDVVFALNRITNSLNSLATDKINEQPTTASPMEYIAGLASKSGIAFQVPVSKFPVPFPYGATLEHLSARYLNDPNRWIEIAALNGLQEPYIDNIGFDLKLLSNGYRNRVIVGSSQVKVLQPVTLFSNTQPRSTYTVIAVNEISPSVFELTLDSDSKDDLSRFKVSQQAYVHAYAFNTVHAGQTIYIPSDTPVDINEFNTANIPGLEQYKDLIRVSGVDFLLTSNTYDKVSQNSKTSTSTAPVGTMDLVVDPTTGDIPLAHGETVLQQTLKLILLTPQGSIMQHPDFGVGVPVGSSIADVNLDGLKDAIKKAILADGSFSDVDFVEFGFKQGVLRIALGVRVAQLNKLLPMSFDINLRPT